MTEHARTNDQIWVEDARKYVVCGGKPEDLLPSPFLSPVLIMKVSPREMGWIGGKKDDTLKRVTIT